MLLSKRVLLLGSAAIIASPAFAWTHGSASIVTGTVELIGTQISSGNSGYSNLLAGPAQTQNTNFWTLTNVTTVDNAATAPDGSTTATAVTESSANARHFVQNPAVGSSFTTATATYLVGCIAAQSLRTRIQLVFQNTAGTAYGQVVFDLAGVQIGVAPIASGSGWSVGTTTITSLPNGFCLCTLPVTVPASASCWIQVRGDAGSGTGALDNSYAGNNASTAFYLAGTFLSNSTTITGNILSNLIDGSGTTWWEDYSPQAWAGIDLGSGNSAYFTGYLFTPESGDAVSTSDDPWFDYPLHMNGTRFNQPTKLLQTSNDPTFASGVTTQDTIPSSTNFTRYDLHQRNFSAAQSRCARLFSPYGHMSQLFFLANAGPTSARPCRPTISPWGGEFPAGTVTVTLASATTSAQIYYTTDGSTPTNASTFYTGPFSLSVSSATVLNAIAYDATGTLSTSTSAVTTGNFTSNKLEPLQNWYDTNGVLVEAHGGVLIQVGSYIYWVGQIMNLFGGGSTGNTTIPRQDYGISLYRCTANQSDPGYLTQWTNLGQILQPAMNGSIPWSGCNRCSVVYNANTNNFCLVAHVHIPANPGRCAFATTSGDNIETGWSWVNNSFNLGPTSGTGGSNDIKYYTNAANTIAYLVYAGADAVTGDNSGIYITQMDSTFVTSVVSTNTVAVEGAADIKREGVVLFDNGTNMFLITGIPHDYWDVGDDDVEYVEAAGLNPMSVTWGSLTGGRVFNSDPATGNYLSSQPTFVFKPTGKAQYILGCDLWDGADGGTLYSSRAAWSPMTITATTISATQPTSWVIGDLS